jgi:hypothetical protein
MGELLIVICAGVFVVICAGVFGWIWMSAYLGMQQRLENLEHDAMAVHKRLNGIQTGNFEPVDPNLGQQVERSK